MMSTPSHTAAAAATPASLYSRLRTRWSPRMQAVCDRYDESMRSHYEWLSQQVMQFQQDKAALVEVLHREETGGALSLDADAVVGDMMPASLQRLWALLAAGHEPREEGQQPQPGTATVAPPRQEDRSVRPCMPATPAFGVVSPLAYKHTNPFLLAAIRLGHPKVPTESKQQPGTATVAPPRQEDRSVRPCMPATPAFGVVSPLAYKHTNPFLLVANRLGHPKAPTESKQQTGSGHVASQRPLSGSKPGSGKKRTMASYFTNKTVNTTDTVAGTLIMPGKPLALPCSRCFRAFGADTSGGPLALRQCTFPPRSVRCAHKSCRKRGNCRPLPALMAGDLRVFLEVVGAAAARPLLAGDKALADALRRCGGALRLAMDRHYQLYGLTGSKIDAAKEAAYEHRAAVARSAVAPAVANRPFLLRLCPGDAGFGAVRAQLRLAWEKVEQRAAALLEEQEVAALRGELAWALAGSSSARADKTASEPKPKRPRLAPSSPPIHTWEVEAAEYVFQYTPFGPGWFVLRCAHGMDWPAVVFEAHPLRGEHGRALGLAHFNDGMCKYHEHKTHTEEEMMVAYARRVVDNGGEDVTRDWATESNENLLEKAERREREKIRRRQRRKPRRGCPGGVKVKTEEEEPDESGRGIWASLVYGGTISNPVQVSDDDTFVVLSSEDDTSSSSGSSSGESSVGEY